jgi:hypothetical protein
MGTARIPVTWEGVVIGAVENLRCDNLNVFGKWCPNDSRQTELFYQERTRGKGPLFGSGKRSRESLRNPREMSWK